MIEYVTFIVFFYILGLSNVRNKKLVFNTLMLSLALLSGFRYNTGTDYNNFVRVFLSYSAGYSVYTEPLYNLYMRIINSIWGTNMLILYMGQALITEYSFANFIQKNVKKNDWIYAGSLFITTTIFFQSMNAARQYFSIALILIAFEYMKKHRFIPFTVLCVLSLFIHSSSLVLVAFLFVIYFALSPDQDYQKLMKFMNIAVILSVFLGIIDIRFLILQFDSLLKYIPFLGRFYGYLSSYFFLSRNRLSFLKFIVPNILWFFSYYHYKDIKKHSNWADCYLLMLAIYVFIENCFSGVNVFIRIAMQFEPVLLIIIPLSVQALSNPKVRLIGKAFFLLYFLALTIYSIFLRGGAGVVPYTSIFSAIDRIYG